MYANAGPPLYRKLQRMTVTGTEVTRIQDAGTVIHLPATIGWCLSVYCLPSYLTSLFRISEVFTRSRLPTVYYTEAFNHNTTNLTIYSTTDTFMFLHYFRMRCGGLAFTAHLRD